MKKHCNISLLAGVAFVAFGASAASAQQTAAETREGTYSLSDIIVTAQKREENVQDVPAAISAYDGKTLEERGLSTAEDLQFAVPGLVISEVSTAEKANVTLRGVGDLAGGDPTVPIHLDGHYLQFTSFITKDFLDVERVEVQRGPQGTLYGRNAVGGTINVITKRPTDHFDLGVTLDIGNYNKRKIQGYISGPLSDNLRVRLAVGDERRDGYVKNLFNGQDLLTSDYTSIRGSLVYEPTEDIEIFISAYHYKDKGLTSVARIWEDYRLEPGTLYDTFRPVNVSAANPWVVNTDVEHTNFDKAKGASFDLTWDLGPVIFKSLSGYHDAKKGGVVDLDASPLAAFKGVLDSGASESYTHELQLLSDTNSPLKFVLGAFYFYEKSREVFEQARNRDCIIFQDPDACENYGFANQTLFIASTEKYQSYAVFGQIDYELTDRLNLSVGARYSHDERDRVNEFGFDFNNYPLSSPPMLTPLKGTWSEPTGKVSLSYDITEDTLVYASASRGYKAGGFSGAVQEPLYKPEILNAYEIGMKGEFFDRRLRVNAAAFYYDYKDKIQDVLETDPNTGQGIESFTNAAAAEVKGIEIEAIARVTEGLTLNAAVSYQNAVYKEFFTEDPANSAAGLQDLSGNKLPMAPDWTVHLGAQYRWDLNDLGSLTARADFSWVDDQYLRQFNEPTEVVDSYHQTNLRLTWESADERFSVAGYVRNLEDKNIVTSLVVGAGSLGFQRYVTYLPPRTYGVILGFKY